MGPPWGRYRAAVSGLVWREKGAWATPAPCLGGATLDPGTCHNYQGRPIVRTVRGKKTPKAREEPSGGPRRPPMARLCWAVLWAIRMDRKTGRASVWCPLCGGWLAGPWLYVTMTRSREKDAACGDLVRVTPPLCGGRGARERPSGGRKGRWPVARGYVERLCVCPPAAAGGPWRGSRTVAVTGPCRPRAQGLAGSAGHHPRPREGGPGDGAERIVPTAVCVASSERLLAVAGPCVAWLVWLWAVEGAQAGECTPAARTPRGVAGQRQTHTGPAPGVCALVDVLWPAGPPVKGGEQRGHHTMPPTQAKERLAVRERPPLCGGASGCKEPEITCLRGPQAVCRGERERLNAGAPRPGPLTQSHLAVPGRGGPTNPIIIRAAGGPPTGGHPRKKDRLVVGCPRLGGPTTYPKD